MINIYDIYRASRSPIFIEHYNILIVYLAHRKGGMHLVVFRTATQDYLLFVSSVLQCVSYTCEKKYYKTEHTNQKILLKKENVMHDFLES